MDKKFKRYKVDYAAAYRHYIDFGGGRTLEKFCQDEGYDFEKFKRYGRDAFWQHLIYKDDSEYEKQKETVMLPTLITLSDSLPQTGMWSTHSIRICTQTNTPSRPYSRMVTSRFPITSASK